MVDEADVSESAPVLDESLRVSLIHDLFRWRITIEQLPLPSAEFKAILWYFYHELCFKTGPGLFCIDPFEGIECASSLAWFAFFQMGPRLTGNHLRHSFRLCFWYFSVSEEFAKILHFYVHIYLTMCSKNTQVSTFKLLRRELLLIARFSVTGYFS